MEPFWTFSAWGWWCLIPMLFMVVAMAACFLFRARRGGCGCMMGGHEGRHEAAPPREPR